jgi:xanthine dehydrogenase accessory factor
MNDLHAVLDTWRRLDGLNADAVLATVVHVSGSAYRRPGARMLIVPDGRRVGSISGGCLEGEITRRAAWLTRSGRPVVRAYDTTSDNAGAWEFGMGCNGIVQIMLESVKAADTREMLDFLDTHRHSRQAAVVATVVRTDARADVQVGDRLLFDEAGVAGGTLIGSTLEREVRQRASSAMSEETSCFARIGTADVFIECVRPPVPLLIFGAGDDAVPLATIAKQLGWHVTVADGRPSYAKAERFPGVDRIVTLRPADLCYGLEIDPDTVVVMMTHNYALDVRLLPRLLDAGPRYLGLLGPRARAEMLFADVGVSPPAFVHAPVGLDIGGDTPAITALSIAAEIQAAVSDRAGGMLRGRDSAIHSSLQEVGPSPPEASEDIVRPSYCETTVGSTV